MTEAQKAAIRTAAFNAVVEVLESMDAKITRTNLYAEATTQAKHGATQALMYFAGDVQLKAAALGGVNRSTLRSNLNRIAETA
jgi:DNA-binding protein Fis